MARPLGTASGKLSLRIHALEPFYAKVDTGFAVRKGDNSTI